MHVIREIEEEPTTPVQEEESFDYVAEVAEAPREEEVEAPEPVPEPEEPGEPEEEEALEAVASRHGERRKPSREEEEQRERERAEAYEELTRQLQDQAAEDVPPAQDLSPTEPGQTHTPPRPAARRPHVTPTDTHGKC